MRILFAGSSDIAVPSLEAVSRSHDIRGVLTNPDTPAGRGRNIRETPVKKKAEDLGLYLLQPPELDEEAVSEVKNLGAHLLVTVAYGTIFRKQFLDLFPRGGINLHPSLLPRYRGPAPLTAAILAGDPFTGITVQELALKMDAGDILLQKRLELSGDETTGSLMEKVAHLGAEMLVQTIDAMEQGTQESCPQDETGVSYCSMVTKEDGLISWESDAEYISRMIRAYDPWPGTYTYHKGIMLKILEGRVSRSTGHGHESRPGLVLGVDKSEGILIQTQKGCLAVSKLQLQAKKPLFWKDFINGNADIIGSVLGETE